MRLDAETRSALVAHARAALAAAAVGEALPEAPAGLRRDDLARHGGVFVTLKRADGGLRGCIGSFGGATTLADEVARITAQSALHDPRFPAVSAGEVPVLRVSLSVLSARVRCPHPNDVEAGRHGVEIELGDRRGVFLPQVAPEQGWDRPELLRQLCLKARLPGDAWRDPQAKLWTFEATVFGE